MTNNAEFQFGNHDSQMFASALNEVINGFTVPEFEKTVGASEEQANSLLNYLASLSQTDLAALDRTQTRVVRNALRETIKELGEEEFHTRTGYDFADGQSILKRLDKLLG